MHTVFLIPGLGSDAAVLQPNLDELAPDVKCQIGNTFSNDTRPEMAALILNGAPARFALAGASMWEWSPWKSCVRRPSG